MTEEQRAELREGALYGTCLSSASVATRNPAMAFTPRPSTGPTMRFIMQPTLCCLSRTARSKHNGIIGAFRERFVKPGLIEAEYSRIYGRVMDDRHRNRRPLEQDVLIGSRVIGQDHWDEMVRDRFSLYKNVTREGIPLMHERA